MADYGTKATDKAIKKLDKEIQSVYKEAERDIQAKMDDFVKKFKPKRDIWKKKLDNGEITQEQYDNWYRGQVFQRNQWKAKKQEIQQVLAHSNQVAVKMINGESIHVFSTNMNYASYMIDKAGSVDFNFQLYDSSAVTNLIKNNPQVLPKWKIDEPKDYVWNGKKVNRQVTQGIVQGESLEQIAKRLAVNLSTQNYNHMKTFARTAMTGAQNAGREQSLKNARDMGLNVVKQWMATLDSRTRDSHAMMDGETIKVGDKWHHYKFSNGLRYPGDPEGPAREVYNCRCTLVGDLEDHPSEYERYDNIDGKPVKQMTYRDWYEAKYKQQYQGKFKPSGMDYSKYGGKEVLEIMKKYDYDYDKFFEDSDLDEFEKVWLSANGSDEVKEWFKNAKTDLPTITKSMTEEEKIQKKIAKAQKEVDKLDHKIKTSGADKTFYNIWDDPVTYADWDKVKDDIPGMRDYWTDRYIKRQDKFIDRCMPDSLSHDDAEWMLREMIKSDELSTFWNANSDYLMNVLNLEPMQAIKVYDDLYSSILGERLRKARQALLDLDELEKYGAEYSKLLKEYERAKKELEEALKLNKVQKPVSTAGSSLFGNKTTEEWIEKCKENPDINGMLEIERKTFNKYTDEQRSALRRYTGSSYEEMNSYLRLVGSGVPHEEAVIRSGINSGQLNAVKHCHDALTIQTLDRDMVLRRGTDVGDLAGLFMQGDFDINMASLRGKSAQELNTMFQGQLGRYLGFTSTSSQWDSGFSGNVEIVFFAPEGTPAASIMNISAFGTGEGETLLRDDLAVVCDRIEESDGHKGSSIRVFLQIIVE